MEVVIISGLSGAGKSNVASSLEDLGFYCIDNMPVALMGRLVDLITESAVKSKYERVALVTDIRALSSAEDLFAALSGLETTGTKYKILFVEADTDTIVKRYKETRRRHPLQTATVGLPDAVQLEKERLAPVRGKADTVIDTTHLTLGGLASYLGGMFPGAAKTPPMGVSVRSFGYKYGLPIEADLVFDVRFLPNPYYVEELRPKTGLSDEVYNYVMQNADTQKYMEMLREMLAFLLPRYVKEGKRYLVVAIGCTGGHHRSVSVARAVAAHIESLGYTCDLAHRDAAK
ncbi:MAG: RNase adapter RapZ [Oscillospiraceae bacterium]|jgi:UPF0042 nucleotide-binding protein|nr:RNase adapter RapZ [Oscillospiraceae bacterium]